MLGTALESAGWRRGPGDGKGLRCGVTPGDAGRPFVRETIESGLRVIRHVVFPVRPVQGIRAWQAWTAPMSGGSGADGGSAFGRSR